jgi:hypothetical protein
MRRQFFLTALAGIGSAALFAGSAVAGGWGSGCGYCGYGDYPTSRVYYAPPTYSYAQPTFTVIPHYVVQPNYVVQRTYVIRQTRYISETVPCLIDCDRSYLVNQGQYTEPALVRPPAYYESYSPGLYPRHYHTRYLPTARRYNERHFHRTYIHPHRRSYSVSSYRVNRHSHSRDDHRKHYR